MSASWFLALSRRIPVSFSNGANLALALPLMTRTSSSRLSKILHELPSDLRRVFARVTRQVKFILQMFPRAEPSKIGKQPAAADNKRCMTASRYESFMCLACTSGRKTHRTFYKLSDPRVFICDICFMKGSSRIRLTVSSLKAFEWMRRRVSSRRKFWSLLRFEAGIAWHRSVLELLFLHEGKGKVT